MRTIEEVTAAIRELLTSEDFSEQELQTLYAEREQIKEQASKQYFVAFTTASEKLNEAAEALLEKGLKVPKFKPVWRKREGASKGGYYQKLVKFLRDKPNQTAKELLAQLEGVPMENLQKTLDRCVKNERFAESKGKYKLGPNAPASKLAPASK